LRGVSSTTLAATVGSATSPSATGGVAGAAAVDDLSFEVPAGKVCHRRPIGSGRATTLKWSTA
jgi:hypothetical protein